MNSVRRPQHYYRFDPLTTHPALFAHGGRDLLVTTFRGPACDPDPHIIHPDLLESIAAMADAGHRRVTLRATSPNWPALTVSINNNPYYVQRQLFSHMKLGTMLVHHEDIDGGVLLSQWLPLTHQYRIAVVGGQLITGSGRGVDPLEHPRYGRFDPRMIADADDEPSECPDHVATHLELARRVCGELAADHQPLVLDLAINAHTGQPLLVDIKSLTGAHLYALDLDELQLAILTGARRRKETARSA